MTNLLTNENEGDGNNEGEDIASDWLIVLSVSFGEEVQSFVDVVFAQSLNKNRTLIRDIDDNKITLKKLSSLPGRLSEH